jgi:replicative DNA helicase
MGKVPDENDRAKAGTLPSDPSADTERARLRVVKPGEKPKTTEPADLGAECALLGALLWAGQNAPDLLRVRSVTDLLPTSEPFYLPTHRHIYDAIIQCIEAKAEHDPVVVHQHLVKTGHDRACGGLEGVRAFLDEASTVSERQARVYAESIRDAWARRKVIAEARELIEDARGTKLETIDLVTKAHKVATQAAERAAQRASFVWIKDSAAVLMKRLTEGSNTAISTGLRDLDNALNGGFRPGEVSVLAARLNVGKSQCAAQIAEFMVTASEDIGVLYVTLEMAHEMFTARVLAGRSGVPLNNIRRMLLTPSQWTSFTGAVQETMPKRLAFADSPAQTLSSIHVIAQAFARVLAADGKRLGMVVIDHLGLVKPSAESLKKASREQQVAETSRGQRFIAQELGCHVMGIAQLGREAEKQGPNSIPKLHHIRETDSIGQDADVVLILHRERNATTGMFNNTKPAALVLAKGRMDEASPMLVEYDGAHARFSDWNGQEKFSDFYGGAT